MPTLKLYLQIFGSYFQDEVWTPDLSLMNSYTEHGPLGYQGLFVHDDYNGSISWSPFQVCTTATKRFATRVPFH